jgi:hypothetical protein
VPGLKHQEKRHQYLDEQTDHNLIIDQQLGLPMEIGNACWVRVKITNNGEVVAKECRAYLQSVSKTTSFSEGWKNIPEFSNSLPLRWAYERHQNFNIYPTFGSGIKLPSKSSYFADVFTIYNPELNLKSKPESWFLKLTTIPESRNHYTVFEIEKSSAIMYKFDIEVYADDYKRENENSRLSIILTHDQSSGSAKLRCLCEKNKNDKPVWHEICLPERKNDININKSDGSKKLTELTPEEQKKTKEAIIKFL